MRKKEEEKNEKEQKGSIPNKGKSNFKGEINKDIGSSVS